MKFTLAFLQDAENIAMFKAMLEADGLDYYAFYQIEDGVYAIAETWEYTHKSTIFIEY